MDGRIGEETMTITVDKMLKTLQEASDAGEGDTPLFAIDTASGVSYSASCHGEARELAEGEIEGGELCEEEPGFRFIPIYL